MGVHDNAGWVFMMGQNMQRSLKYQLKVARFPIHRDLVNFKWDETPLIKPNADNRPSGT